MEPTRINFEPHEIPKHWYNVMADMPMAPSPPLGPDRQPVPPEAWQAIFPDSLIEQEMSSQLYHEKLIEAVAVPQRATFEAGVMFARAEGIVPAPESCHAIRTGIDEALMCKASGEPKVILINLTGHGHFDMAAYDRYFAGELEDYDYPDDAVLASLQNLPKVG